MRLPLLGNERAYGSLLPSQKTQLENVNDNSEKIKHTLRSMKHVELYRCSKNDIWDEGKPATSLPVVTMKIVPHLHS